MGEDIRPSGRVRGSLTNCVQTLLLYRCIKPLWFNRVQKLKAAGGDLCAVKACLDKTEFLQTIKIDFATYMCNLRISVNDE